MVRAAWRSRYYLEYYLLSARCGTRHVHTYESGALE